MDSKEELRYLIKLLQDSAAWRLSEGDDRSPLEIEVDSRINALLGEPDEVEEDGRKHNLPKESNRIRITLNGKKTWANREDCVQVPCKNSKTGFKWVLKDFQVGADSVVVEAENVVDGADSLPVEAGQVLD